MKWIHFLILSVLFFATYVAYSTFTHKKTIYVYMWSDYIHPSIIDEFQKKYDCWVIVDNYDSNEAMYTKLLLGASGYDVVFPSNYFIELMAGRGMLRPVEPQEIPNCQYIDTDFLEKKLGLEPVKYGTPYMMTFAGIAWRNDRIDPRPLEWNLFSSHNLQGRMTLLNDMRETIGAGLQSLGFWANSLNKEEIHKAKEHIIRHWRPRIAKFESEQYKNGIANGEYLAVHGFSGDCIQVMSRNPHVSFGYPKGPILTAVDYAAIMSSSKNPDLALAFINFLLDPVTMSQNMQFTCARAPHTHARVYLSDDLKNSKILYPEDDPSQTFECLKPIGTAQEWYTEAWDDIKAGRL